MLYIAYSTLSVSHTSRWPASQSLQIRQPSTEQRSITSNNSQFLAHRAAIQNFPTAFTCSHGMKRLVRTSRARTSVPEAFFGNFPVTLVVAGFRCFLHSRDINSFLKIKYRAVLLPVHQRHILRHLVHGIFGWDRSNGGKSVEPGLCADSSQRFNCR